MGHPALTARDEHWAVASGGRAKVGHVVRPLDASLAEGDVVLLGLCNEGEGRAFRCALAGMSASALCGRGLFDAGDLERARVDLVLSARVLGDALIAGANVVVVGSAPECAGAASRALRRAGIAPALVNIDPRLDARATHLPSSGVPLYRLVEDGLGALTDAGILGAPNAPSHLEYVRSRGMTLSYFDGPGAFEPEISVEEMPREPQHAIALCIDVDAIDSTPGGLSAHTVRQLVWSAARGGARALVLEERSPHRPSTQTAQIAALLVCDLFAGYAARGASIRADFARSIRAKVAFG